MRMNRKSRRGAPRDIVQLPCGLSLWFCLGQSRASTPLGWSVASSAKPVWLLTRPFSIWSTLTLPKNRKVRPHILRNQNSRSVAPFFNPSAPTLLRSYAASVLGSWAFFAEPNEAAFSPSPREFALSRRFRADSSL